jgi:hypothetical protein
VASGLPLTCHWTSPESPYAVRHSTDRVVMRMIAIAGRDSLLCQYYSEYGLVEER